MPQPSPESADLTANWETYTNLKYGYSIKYPTIAKLEEREVESGNHTSIILPVGLCQSSYKSSIKIHARKKLKSESDFIPCEIVAQSYRMLIKDVNEGRIEANIPECKIETSIKGGVIGVKIYWCMEFPDEPKVKDSRVAEYYINKDIYYAIEVGRNENCKENFEQILSTFKFTN